MNFSHLFFLVPIVIIFLNLAACRQSQASPSNKLRNFAVSQVELLFLLTQGGICRPFYLSINFFYPFRFSFLTLFVCSSRVFISYALSLSSLAVVAHLCVLLFIPLSFSLVSSLLPYIFHLSSVSYLVSPSLSALGSIVSLYIYLWFNFTPPFLLFSHLLLASIFHTIIHVTSLVILHVLVS